MSAMKVMTARVVDVAVPVSQTSDFCSSETEQEELELAVAEIRRGEYTDGRELLRELKGLAEV